jgi:hypothetical protein
VERKKKKKLEQNLTTRRLAETTGRTGQGIKTGPLSFSPQKSAQIRISRFFWTDGGEIIKFVYMTAVIKHSNCQATRHRALSGAMQSKFNGACYRPGANHTGTSLI